MANLTAVLRKTIDGLPNASPQLRAKVYEKARAAITRQIEAANPPLDEHVVEARYRVLEDAIRETEAHYAPPPATEPHEAEPAAPVAAERDGRAIPASPPGVFQPEPPAPYEPEPEAWSPPATVVPPAPRANDPVLSGPRSLLRQTPAAPREPAPVEPVSPREPRDDWSSPVRLDETQASVAANERAPQPAFPRATPTTRPPATPAFPRVSTSEAGAPLRPSEPMLDRRSAPADTDQPVPGDDTPRVGEIGPSETASGSEPFGAPQLRPATIPPRALAREPASTAPFAGIPEPDLAAPRYPARRARSKDRSRLGLGVAAVAIVALGAAGWFYLDDIRGFVTGSGAPQVASSSPGTTDQAEPPASVPGDQPPATAAAPQGEVTDTAPPAAGTAPAAGGVRPRQFTQRLLPDGSEVDEGPGANAANAFEEGTNVVAAEVSPAPSQARDAPPAATPATPPAAATPPAQAQAPIAVGQRAVFYEERSANKEGTQQDGNVVWSVVREPPAEGQPPEPAIRAVAEIPSTGMKMTMTIRRNADQTLPASHVIEIMFDTPNGAPGGGIENVQRLALKPTEQARGEPLIGISGKISDGFFIIALNDLEQAMRTNLALLGREEWIDIPLAYTSGQRALMSIEKGIPGSRVFKEALDAWAAKT